MEIKQIQAIEGANVYSLRPIIRAIVDLQEWTGITSDKIAGFNQRLLDNLPGLAAHYCSLGRPGGFVERLREGTLIGHVLEHVTIELLTQAGQTIKYGKTEATLNYPGEYEIVFNYQSKGGAIEAFKRGFKLVKDILGQTKVDVQGAIRTVEREIAANEQGVSTNLILQACAEREIPVQQIAGSLLQLGYGKNQRRVQAAMSDRTSCISVDMAGDKGLTKDALEKAGVPIPFGYVARGEEEAVEAFYAIGAPVVIKPYNGNQGKGVSLKLKSEGGVRSAFRVAQAYGEEVIIEEYIEGRHYRLLIIGNRMIAAAERVPPHITGDGISSIEELIEQTNQDPMRGEDHEKPLTKIKIDPVVILTLSQKSLSLKSILPKGQVMFLRDSANLSTGGIACDVTDKVHPDNRDLAVYAARILGLDIAGVDFVISDIAQSHRINRGCVIEINASPGLRMHRYPSVGQGRDVGKMIIDYVFPQGNGRIPIISVTGTNGKTTTTRLIGKMLLDQHIEVGMTTTDGIYINGKLFCKGDFTGPDSARSVLRHPDVQAAVLETARGGILRGGIGYDYADVAVITNVSNDHLGQYGIETTEDIAHVKSLVAELVKPHSYVVLNADDPLVLRMAERTTGRVILYSLTKDNLHVRKHLGKGGVGVIVQRGNVLLCQGAESYKICAVRKIPITWEGKARHNIQNLLAAVGAGWALGLTSEAMMKSLSGFYSDEKHNHGRLNFYDIQGSKVFLDYGHNPAGIKEVIRTLKQFKGAALTGCITVPGDRPDEIIYEVGQIAGKGFNQLIIREDDDLRGRKAGEVAAIIKTGALDAGMKESQIATVLPEREAFIYGLERSEPGDIFVMFYEHIEPLEEEIQLRLNNGAYKIKSSCLTVPTGTGL